MTTFPISIELNFAIVGCECKIFNFTRFAQENKTSIATDKYQFTSNISTQIDAEKKLISVEIRSVLSGNSEEVKGQLATVESVIDFNVVNIEEILINSEQGTLLPDQVMAQFLSISFSTLRGMLAIKLEGSLYSNAIFPIIDVSRLLPKKSPLVG
jgi:hypothetical protein